MKLNVIALAALMGFGAASVQASELPDSPHIVTSGTASVDAAPDIATLAIEVNVAAKDAATAKKQADDRVAQYLSFLEQNGVGKKDINSANLRTQPDYDYKDGKSILKGYRAVRTVEVTVRQLDKLNSLLDGALKAGLNEIRSVSLGVAQPEKYKDEARKAAIDDAVRQAQQLASGFNSKLGPVYSVRYHVSNYQPSPMVRMMKSEAAPVSAQDTYEQPTIQFDDQVDVVFQLEPAQGQQQSTQAQQNEQPQQTQEQDTATKAP
ncbi:oxidative stress defense protein [Leclercia adecarboxylata]|uniref:oxidative stress defense protein n=1 Tax=Leclercia adecarboxylata TaxID=83655 RepID=UPI0012A8D0DF|nr:oxidative stress defense protein [Leclercia adecarboxylata]QFH66565.1 oxidative stress defense protein [Leclercia adecarboxylata]QGP85205.1 oxidative stress defense protein [Leclercia adecarboxylata]